MVAGLIINNWTVDIYVRRRTIFILHGRGHVQRTEELLSYDGVLGGANDSEFGGRRKFARVSTAKDDANATRGGAKGGGGRNVTSAGFEAASMEEGFYQRDVAAEYEVLDYDVEEQFDDDDVNVREDEMMDDGGGYGGDYINSDDDNLLDS